MMGVGTRQFGPVMRMILTYLKGCGGECTSQRVMIARDIGRASLSKAFIRLEHMGMIVVWKRPVLRPIRYVTLTDRGREMATLIERGES